MAEITKVTTPMVPKENIGNKFKPVSDQAFDMTDPSKVHKADQEGKAAERQSEASQNLQRDTMGRAAIIPLLKNTSDMAQIMKRVGLLVEAGVSAADAAGDVQIKELLESLFVSPQNFAKVLSEQDKGSILFKGEAFDVLRDILGKFSDQPKVKATLANLLKIFDLNVNSQNSVKTILYNSTNILDYMFSKDREQFSNYLKGLAEMLLPPEEAKAFTGTSPTAQNPGAAAQASEEAATHGVDGEEMQQANVQQQADAQDAKTQASQNTKNAQAAGNTQDGAPPMSQKEMAGILKNNLLPLLGEIVVKYHQNEHIRDIVMVVVHNIVRVDQGTPEALREAVSKLINELKQVANMPEGFEKNLLEAIKENVDLVKTAPNSVISKLSDIISETLSSPNANPAIARQAETMLISMLQNQSSLMDVLHFVIPMQTQEGQVFTELYIDPETEEKVGKQQGKSRKIFISVESEAHGPFELSFLETGGHVDFQMWCPDVLVGSLGGLKRQFANVMQMHGYTMNSFKVDEMREPHSVAEVFPRLLEKKVGVDVRI